MRALCVRANAPRKRRALYWHAGFQIPHFTKYLLSYIGCHGYILYRNVPKLWDYVGNRSSSSTTKFGNPNLTARYFLNTPKIAENRKISNLKDTHYLKFSAPS